MTFEDNDGDWRKASRSTNTESCVELRSTGAVRDSKNPTGPTLIVSVADLLTAIKAGQLGSRPS
jgi:hypothetical protein